MSTPIRSIITEKKYYLITNPHIPDLYVENYGDRVFRLKPINGRWTEFPEVSFGGDTKWDITKENILKAANFILEERLSEREAEKQKDAHTKHPSYCCQKCGDQIGWIGRLLFGGLLHTCKK